MNKKTIVLGVTGSIAAYKSAEICSQLTKLNFNVIVIMTNHAQKFITPLTFLTLSRNPVVTTLFDDQNWKPEHISLSEQASLMLIAPATANILAKAAHGIADDSLSTAILSNRSPLLIAPAMNSVMWDHPTTQQNIQILKNQKVHFIGPDQGDLACGTQGLGRMIEVSRIIESVKNLLSP